MPGEARVCAGPSLTSKTEVDCVVLREVSQEAALELGLSHFLKQVGGERKKKKEESPSSLTGSLVLHFLDLT